MTKKYGDINVDLVNMEPDKTGANAGIRWRQIAGFVPFYEEHQIRITHRLSLDEWYALEPLERAFHVACDRIDRAVKAHQASAEAVKMEQQQKRMKNARSS